ncbi:hypothetical protein DdX_18727 [Ditylenchus destructor]|uniref:Uncharacterized protein n=1 Tax=Ditylenchus destructor TaxID=166010 RepID=A0AAD4QXU2_9BILA|nr:hypothetical protein DdX_18727 [Ditylenchus destructor]
MDVQPKIASSSESEQTHSGEDREKQDLHNGDTQKANISRKKRNHLGDAPGISVESSKKRKVPLNDKQSAHGICIMARKRPNSSLDTYEPLEEESSSDKENFDAPVEFIKTQMQATKGPGVLLAHEGHLYWHQKGDMEGCSFWKCVLSRKHKQGEFRCSSKALPICHSSHGENHALLRLIVGTFLLRHQNEDWCDMNMEPGIEPVKALLPYKNSGERNKWGCGAHILADANVHSDQSSSEIDQSSDSSGDGNDESLATTNENDRHRKLTTSTQDVLDGTNDPDPKLKISNIMIDISYGTVFFVTSTGNYYPKRPLCDYMSILRESEADVRGCEAHIVFRAPFLGGYRAELIFCAQSVLGSEEKFEQFSEDVHSISRLWENGRISVELYNYSDIARAYICMRDFCEALFGQDRCILKCKVLEINWFGEWWPFFVITNVVNHCNELMFKIKQHMKQKLHNTFLDILYKAELPRHIEISVELDYNYYKYDMLNGLRERFKDSNAQYFKFKLVSSGFRNELLQNDHGTLEIKLVDSHHEDDGRRRETVIIEQKPHSSVPDKQSA